MNVSFSEEDALQGISTRVVFAIAVPVFAVIFAGVYAYVKSKSDGDDEDGFVKVVFEECLLVGEFICLMVFLSQLQEHRLVLMNATAKCNLYIAESPELEHNATPTLWRVPGCNLFVSCAGAAAATNASSGELGGTCAIGSRAGVTRGEVWYKQDEWLNDDMCNLDAFTFNGDILSKNRVFHADPAQKLLHTAWFQAVSYSVLSFMLGLGLLPKHPVILVAVFIVKVVLFCWVLPVTALAPVTSGEIGCGAVLTGPFLAGSTINGIMFYILTLTFAILFGACVVACCLTACGADPEALGNIGIGIGACFVAFLVSLFIWQSVKVLGRMTPSVATAATLLGVNPALLAVPGVTLTLDPTQHILLRSFFAYQLFRCLRAVQLGVTVLTLPWTLDSSESFDLDNLRQIELR